MATSFPANVTRSDRVEAPVARIPTVRLVRFAAFSVPLYAAAQPVIAFVPAIYARDFGIPLTTLGLIYLTGQILNSLLDPAIGLLSDRTTSPAGRRRPWIAAGGLLFLIGSAMLFFPPASPGVAWVSAGVLLYYLGAAASSTPLLAWSGEVSRNYAERTRIAGLFTLISSSALVLALLLPTLADQVRPDDGPFRLALFGTLVAVTGLPGLMLTLTALPDHPAVTPARFELRTALRSIFANRLLVRVLASDLAVTAGQGIRTGLLLFVVTFYLGKPEWAAGFFLFQYSFGLLSGPVWQRIGIRIGKTRAAVLAETLQATINAALLFVTADRFGLMLALALAQGLTQGSGNLMLRAMVADVADQERLRSGEDRSGLYYSVFSVSAKLGGALAAGIAFPLVAWLGFDPKGANSPEALQALLTVFALGPALAHAASALIIARFDLDEAAHSEIRRKLDAGAPAFVPAE